MPALDFKKMFPLSSFEISVWFPLSTIQKQPLLVFFLRDHPSLPPYILYIHVFTDHTDSHTYFLFSDMS